jgi:hypothetical protein
MINIFVCGALLFFQMAFMSNAFSYDKCSNYSKLNTEERANCSKENVRRKEQEKIQKEQLEIQKEHLEIQREMLRENRRARDKTDADNIKRKIAIDSQVKIDKMTELAREIPPPESNYKCAAVVDDEWHYMFQVCPQNKLAMLLVSQYAKTHDDLIKNKKSLSSLVIRSSNNESLSGGNIKMNEYENGILLYFDFSGSELIFNDYYARFNSYNGGNIGVEWNINNISGSFAGYLLKNK